MDDLAKGHKRAGRPHLDSISGRHRHNEPQAVGEPAQALPVRRWRMRSSSTASRRLRNGSSHRRGQHVELGIAEMNLFLLLGAAGLAILCLASV